MSSENMMVPSSGPVVDKLAEVAVKTAEKAIDGVGATYKELSPETKAFSIGALFGWVGGVATGAAVVYGILKGK